MRGVSPRMSEIGGVSFRKGVSVGERDQEKFRRGVRKCHLRERHQWDSGTRRSKSWRDSGTREGMNESGKKGVWHGRE